jgi:DNA-binding NarL/FixJ family response regulator
VAIKVVLVEDSLPVREQLAELVGKIPGVEISGQYEDAASAIAGIRNRQPHAVLLDIKLHASSGLEVIKAIRSEHPDIRFIILSNYAEAPYRELFLKQGAYAILDKSNEFHLVAGLLAQLVHSI